MNKKLFPILFTLFLIGVLSVSCSNKDTTSQGTGIDSKYAGNWITGGFTISELNGQEFTINQDGSITPKNGTTMEASKITKNSSTSYSIYSENTDPVTGEINAKTTTNIDFTSDTSAIMTIILENINPSQKYEYKGNLTRQ